MYYLDFNTCTDETVPEDFDEKSPNPDKPLTTKTPFQDPVSMLLYKLARNIIKTKRNGMNMPSGLPLKGKKYFPFIYFFSKYQILSFNKIAEIKLKFGLF